MSVSVPYRGATFLNTESKIINNALEQFPSPIGELHFSIVNEFLQVRGFVSVPYRGATFLNLYLLIAKTNKNKCLRPLSGSYISQSAILCRIVGVKKFPSPIGELHFSIKKVV